MLNSIEIFNATREQRGVLITQEANLLPNDSEIEQSQKLSQVINTFIESYFDLLIQNDLNRHSGSVLDSANISLEIDNIIISFRDIAIEQISRAVPDREDMMRDAKNLYELGGTSKLAGANKITRYLSTTMGLLWEKIANISPYTVNPESEFNIKIKGIDLITSNRITNLIEYQQLKTQHNTLTGSQRSRSVQELEIHENPVFCASFTLGNWTFNHSNIPRVSGAEFWNCIGIEYSLLEIKVKDLFMEFERVFISL